jgi:hypothetical protein
MFTVAWRQRDRRKALGQVVPLLVAAAGSALGRYPEGNTGRATVPLTQPMLSRPISRPFSLMRTSDANVSRTARPHINGPVPAWDRGHYVAPVDK